MIISGDLSQRRSMAPAARTHARTHARKYSLNTLKLLCFDQTECFTYHGSGKTPNEEAGEETSAQRWMRFDRLPLYSTAPHQHDTAVTALFQEN